MSPNQPRRGIVSNIGSLLTGNILGHGITLAATPLLSRIYGPAAFGAFALFVAISMALSVLATLRYELAIVLPKTHSQGAVVKRSVTLIVVATSAITFVTFGFFYLLAREPLHLPPWVLLLAIAMLLSGEVSVMSYWLTRTKRFRAQGTSRVIQAGAMAVTQLALGVTTLGGAESLIIGHLVGLLAALAWLAFCDDSGKYAKRPVLRQFKVVLARFRKFPLLNAPNALVDAARTNLIYTIIGGKASITAVGQYSMAMRVIQAPIAIIGTAVSPVFLQFMADAPRGALRRLVIQSIGRLSLVGIIPFTALALVAPAALPWILGEEWSQAGLYAQALTPWFYISFVTSPVSNVFVVAERQEIVLGFAVCYTLVPLVPLLIFGSDLLSAIWGMSFVMCLMLVLFLLLAISVARRYDLRP